MTTPLVDPARLLNISRAAVELDTTRQRVYAMIARKELRSEMISGIPHVVVDEQFEAQRPQRRS